MDPVVLDHRILSPDRFYKNFDSPKPLARKKSSAGNENEICD
jgi:hypothetical protein